MRKVLIADPNTPFATVVGEALRRLGGYTFQLAASGLEAQQICAEMKPDLVVIDVDLPECVPATLIQQMRETIPGLPVVLIPYSKDDVPADLNIQGILTKPFFLPDLPELINSILGPPPESEVESVTYTVPLSSARSRPGRTTATEASTAKPVVITDGNRPAIEGHVEALSHALREEPVLLTQGTNVVTIAPRLSEAASAALAEVVAKAWHGNTPHPGSEVVRFGGDTETTRYMLYSFAVAGDLVLSLALRVRIPLPTLRRLVRDAAAELIAAVTE